MTKEGTARWAAVALVVLALLFYENSFSVPFVYDDVPAIAGNPSLQSVAAALRPPPHLTTSGRPLVNLTLALNYAVGGTDVRGYHAVNLAIHVLAALTLFGLVRRTLPRPPLQTPFGSNAVSLSFAIAAIWMLHPLQTEAVTYVVQRAESLVGLFYLLTIYCFVRAVLGPEGGPTTRPTPWLVASIAACALGMASKEVMVSAPLLVLLYDRTFVAGSFRAAWQQHRGVYLGLAATWLVLAALLVSTGGTRDGSAGFGQGMTWSAYALTQAKAIALYLRLSLWPAPLVFDYGNATVPFAAALPYVALMLALIAGTLLALRRRPALGFAGVWFFAILAPSSSIVPVVTETMAEHRMYLPLAAVIACVVLAVHGRFGRRSLVLLAVTAVLLGVGTTQRNETYHDHVALWSDTVEKMPANPRAHNHLGAALSAVGLEKDALRHYEEALRLDPQDAKLRFNVATALFRAGRGEEAENHFRETLRQKPDHADAHNNYGDLLLRRGRREEAMHHFAATLRLDPGFAPAHNNLGIALGSAGRLDEAIVQFQAALRERPDYAEAHNNLGYALKNLGQSGEAIAHFQTAVRLAPRFAEAHNNLALALVASGRTTEGIFHLREVIRLEPDYAEARTQLARILNPTPR
ncbi:MAG TPA: tetratricopeptide repeat protein [Opitutaceae bacterium]|nr:tetratricopeptide repeat protein [Opitutaceae bacterium]